MVVTIDAIEFFGIVIGFLIMVGFFGAAVIAVVFLAIGFLYFLYGVIVSSFFD